MQVRMTHPKADCHGLCQIGFPGVQPEFEHLPLVQQPLVPASKTIQISRKPYGSHASFETRDGRRQALLPAAAALRSGQRGMA